MSKKKEFQIGETQKWQRKVYKCVIPVDDNCIYCHQQCDVDYYSKNPFCDSECCSLFRSDNKSIIFKIIEVGE